MSKSMWDFGKVSSNIRSVHNHRSKPHWDFTSHSAASIVMASLGSFSYPVSHAAGCSWWGSFHRLSWSCGICDEFVAGLRCNCEALPWLSVPVPMRFIAFVEDCTSFSNGRKCLWKTSLRDPRCMCYGSCPIRQQFSRPYRRNKRSCIDSIDVLFLEGRSASIRSNLWREMKTE